jgi:MSHA biogenesis protein MshL
MRKQWLLFLLLTLTACATHQPLNGTAIDDMSVELHQSIHSNEAISGNVRRSPSEISRALLPDIKFRAPHRMDYLQRRFNVSVKEVPAPVFYMGLVKDTPISIVVSPEIKGNVTVSLKQVTIEQALQAMEDAYGYIYNRIPSGYEIVPNKLQTQIFTINYLELTRSGHSDMRLHSGEVTEVVQGQASTGGGGGGSAASGSGGGGAVGAPGLASVAGGGVTSIQGSIGRVKTESTINFWRDLKQTLDNIIGVAHSTSEAQTTTTIVSNEPQNGDNRSVTVNPIAGVIVVRAYPKELKQVATYLDMVQHNMDRQVILEAKILEVTLNDRFQMGIDWQAFANNLKSVNIPGTPVGSDLSPVNGDLVRNVQLNSIANFPNTGITGDELLRFGYGGTIKWTSDFITTIRLLGTQGNVQVLSSPRVATMNNQQSLIKVGTDEFFVSGISAGQAALGAVAQASQQITPFFSGITLDVTPQIDVHGDVTLHIHPSVSLVTEQTKLIDAGTGPQPTPLARSTIRESDTVVHAKNGQVVIIGGLMQNQTIEDIAELPFFGNVPFLGTLFRSTRQTSEKSELVILLKATIVNKRTLDQDLNYSTQRVADLKRGFHVGGRPDIFGTEGEEPIKLGPKAGYYESPRRIRCKKNPQLCLAKKKPSLTYEK